MYGTSLLIEAESTNSMMNGQLSELVKFRFIIIICGKFGMYQV